MSITNLVLKAFAGLVALLNLEASKHGKAGAKKERKAADQKRNEHVAVANMRRAGLAYRAELYADADKHQRVADRASALASKIGDFIK